jgi:DNA-directed RNA polymerase II subunit RPB2
MERDCIISHGISRFLRERTFLASDFFRIHVCSGCGLMAVANIEKSEYKCNNCSSVRGWVNLGVQEKGTRHLPGDHAVRC